jgi:hypothetical protein
MSVMLNFIVPPGLAPAILNIKYVIDINDLKNGFFTKSNFELIVYVDLYLV